MLFRETDELWHAMKKICVAGFYKDKLKIMMETVKDNVKKLIEKWTSEIDSNSNGCTVIDMGIVFEELFCRNIVQITFGEDISNI